jgi:hypothetical protein
MYYFNGTHYRQLNSKLVGSGSSGVTEQGFCVSLDGSGKQLLFGGSRDNGNQPVLLLNVCCCVVLIMCCCCCCCCLGIVGAAWVFENTAITTAPSFAPTISKEPTTTPTTTPTTNQPSVKPSSTPQATKEVSLVGSLNTTSVTILAIVVGVALLCALFLIRYCRSRNMFGTKGDAAAVVGEMTNWIEDAKTNKNNTSNIQLQHASMKAEGQSLMDIYGGGNNNNNNNNKESNSDNNNNGIQVRI